MRIAHQHDNPSTTKRRQRILKKNSCFWQRTNHKNKFEFWHSQSECQPVTRHQANGNTQKKKTTFRRNRTAFDEECMTHRSIFRMNFKLRNIHGQKTDFEMNIPSQITWFIPVVPREISRKWLNASWDPRVISIAMLCCTENAFGNLSSPSIFVFLFDFFRQILFHLEYDRPRFPKSKSVVLFFGHFDARPRLKLQKRTKKNVMPKIQMNTILVWMYGIYNGYFGKFCCILNHLFYA